MIPKQTITDIIKAAILAAQDAGKLSRISYYPTSFLLL